MRFWLILTFFINFFNYSHSYNQNVGAIEIKTEKMSGVTGPVWAVTVDSKNNVYAGNTDGTVYKSISGTSDFKAISEHLGIILALAVDSKDNVYAGGYNGRVYKSISGTSDFKAISEHLGIIESLAVDSKDNVYAGCYNGTVYKSNGTDTFSAIAGASGEIRSLAVDSKDNIYAGSRNGTVYKSISGTSDFKPLTGTSGEIWSLAVDSKDNIYAGSYNGRVYKSISGTSDFKAISEHLGTIASLAVDSKDNVYAGSRNGTVYKSISGTSDFKAISEQLGIIKDLAVDSKDNLYVASDTYAVFKIYEVEKQQINLNGLSNNVGIIDVIKGNLNSFKEKLIEKLQVDQFTKLSLNDLEITKSDGSQLVANDIVTNPNLAVKITAKSSSADFIGDKIVSVDLTTIDSRVNLSYLNNSIDVDNVHEKDISTFKSKMLAELKVTSDPRFKNLSLSDVDITKLDSSPLSANDIITNPNLAVKITAKSSSADFTGFKDVNVNLTTIDSRTDLNSLVNLNPINNVINGDLNTFLTALIQQLNQQTDFSDLLLDDVNITKGDGSQLVNSDIDTTNNLAIKITAKTDNVKFINSKNLTVNLTTKDYKFIVITVASDGTLWVAQNYDNKTILFKSNGSTDNSLFEVKEFNNLTINALVVNNNGVVYIGTTNGLYEGNSNNTNFTKINNISDSVTALTISSNGNIWVGTKITSNTGKVYQGINNRFTEISGTQGAINTIMTHNHDVWVGTTSGQNSGGLYKSTNNNGFSQILTSLTESVQSLAIEKDGTVWIGTKTGFGTGSLYQLQVDDTFNKISSVVNTVSALAIENDGTLLIGTQTGFGMGNLYELESDNSLNSVSGTTGVISCLAVDNINKKIWIGTTNGSETGNLYQADELDNSVAKNSNTLLVVGIIILTIVILFIVTVITIYLVKNKKQKIVSTSLYD